METVYNVIKESRFGDDEGKVIASFATSKEAEAEIQRIQAKEDSDGYNYFVQTARIMP